MELQRTYKRRLSVRTSVAVIAAAVLIAGAAELKALKAKEDWLNHPKKLNAAECVRCHSDQKSISVMRIKEDGAGYLFNKDGTFKDPSLARLNPPK